MILTLPSENAFNQSIIKNRGFTVVYIVICIDRVSMWCLKKKILILSNCTFRHTYPSALLTALSEVHGLTSQCYQVWIIGSPAYIDMHTGEAPEPWEVHSYVLKANLLWIGNTKISYALNYVWDFPKHPKSIECQCACLTSAPYKLQGPLDRCSSDCGGLSGKAYSDLIFITYPVHMWKMFIVGKTL